MEGYKSFGKAAEEISAAAEQWKFSGSGSIFSRDELLSLSRFYDARFSPAGDGWHYFVTFPTGEIGLLNTADNGVEILFTPVKQ